MLRNGFSFYRPLPNRQKKLSVIEDADSHSAQPFPPAVVLDVFPARKILGHPFPTISELMDQMIQLVIL
jgi:hypothetical protein